MRGCGGRRERWASTCASAAASGASGRPRAGPIAALRNASVAGFSGSSTAASPQPFQRRAVAAAIGGALDQPPTRPTFSMLVPPG
jgi:hypothetical protein